MASGSTWRAQRTRPLGLALLAGTIFGGVGGGGGCSSPFDPSREGAEAELRRSIADSISRELREPAERAQTQETRRASRVQTLELKDTVLQELERKSGPGSYPPPGLPDLVPVGRVSETGVQFGSSLVGGEQQAVSVNLQRAVLTAVSNNLSVQFARLSPAIDEARLLAAQAAFDWLFFTNFTWNSIDAESVSTQQIPGLTPARTFDERQVMSTQVGLRKALTTGGSFTVQQSFDYSDNGVGGLVAVPDPAVSSDTIVQIDQPLLRGFGSDVALAQVRIAANSERDKIAQLKAQLLTTITDTETAYWDLVQAYGNLQISKRLLDRGIEVREVLRDRREFDTNPSQYSNAVAAVESRRGDVIRAENTVRSASDQLKNLLNDPELTIGSEILILPVDVPIDAPVRFSLLDSIQTGLANRPEVSRALLAIDDTSIRQRLADNARLPRLDLRAQIRLSGLAESADRALSQELEGELITYLVGLQFEQPVGNRAAEAGFRQRRLEKMQSVTVYRDVVQRIVLDVKNALRDVVTSYQLIEQNRAFRFAAAEDLRTTEVREKTLQALSPEFLDLKLRKQEALARAELQELGSLTAYNTSIARLAGAMGNALERNRIKFDVSETFDDNNPGLESATLPPTPVLPEPK
ncbi:MAG: TolC family protein [Phycisphaerales bacterium]